jgi:hypothetical protein
MDLKDSNPDPFHGIDSRPVWWTGAEAGNRASGSVVDCDRASGLVSSLVISTLVTDSAAWAAGRAVYLPASADCSRVAPGRGPQAQQRPRRGRL